MNGQTTNKKIQAKKVFNLGDNVITIQDSIIRRGVIVSAHIQIEPPIFIVKYEDGSVEKCGVSALAHDPSEEENIEPIEITLTRDHFIKVSAKLIAQQTKGDEHADTRRVLAYFIRDLADTLFTTNEDID